jgi:hypothetical protein
VTGIGVIIATNTAIVDIAVIMPPNMNAGKLFAVRENIVNGKNMNERNTNTKNTVMDGNRPLREMAFLLEDLLFSIPIITNTYTIMG